MTVIGFTGTQKGMTFQQKLGVNEILVKLRPDEVHHGLCIGADADFHLICRELWYLGIFIVGHPGVNSFGASPKLAHCDVDRIMPILPYMIRNSNIVNACDILIATPKGFEEKFGSGTWSTIRKARLKNLTIFIVFPDGRIGE